jgi:hypothetical protein
MFRQRLLDVNNIEAAQRRDESSPAAFHHAHCTAERPVKQTTDHQALPISQLSRKMRQSRRVMPHQRQWSAQEIDSTDADPPSISDSGSCPLIAKRSLFLDGVAPPFQASSKVRAIVTAFAGGQRVHDDNHTQID